MRTTGHLLAVSLPFGVGGGGGSGAAGDVVVTTDVLVDQLRQEGVSEGLHSHGKETVVVVVEKGMAIYQSFNLIASRGGDHNACSSE